MIINPGNPTGQLLSEDDIAGIVKVAGEEGLLLLAGSLKTAMETAHPSTVEQHTSFLSKLYPTNAYRLVTMPRRMGGRKERGEAIYLAST